MLSTLCSTLTSSSRAREHGLLIEAELSALGELERASFGEPEVYEPLKPMATPGKAYSSSKYLSPTCSRISDMHGTKMDTRMTSRSSGRTHT